MKQLLKPDWNNSNLNISATLAEFLHAPNKNATLQILKEELKNNYKNIVFICFDGMGINPLTKNLKKKDLIRKNIVQTLTSTFPSTTTNATTSLSTNLLPLEHGWLGWSLHFKEINQNIDIYLHKNSQTGESVDYTYPIVDTTKCYFDFNNSEYTTTLVVHESIMKANNTNKQTFVTEDEMFENIKNICNKNGKQFIYCYHMEPDSTMHKYGVKSKQAKQLIKNINNKMEKLFNETQDTLFIITSDHGQIDVKGYIEFYKDKELNDMLKCVPYLDARTPAFIVKDGMHNEFETKFNKKYGKHFKLFKTKDLVEQNYFGKTGNYEYLLGDFIAVGTYTHKQFLSYENMPRFKGHHTSLTEEMLVPLILLNNKNEKENKNATKN